MPFSWFFFIQLVCVLLACGISGGGGNTPYAVPQVMFYIKAVLLLVPMLCFSVTCIGRPAGAVADMLSALKRQRYLWLGMACYVLLLPLAVNPSYSAVRLFYTVLLMMSVTALLAQNMRYTWRYTIGCVVFLAVVLFGLFLLGGGATFRDAIQTSHLMHPNTLANVIGVLVLGVLYDHASMHRITRMMAIVIGIAVLYAIFSRAAILALLAVIAVMPFIIGIMRRSSLFILVGLGGVLMLCLAGLAVTLDEGMRHAVLAFIARGHDIDSLYHLTHRTTLWGILWHNSDLMTWLSGYGYAVIDRGYGIDFGTGILYGAHNAYLSALMGGGIAVLVCFVTYLMAMMRDAIRHKDVGMVAIILFFAMICGVSEEFGVTVTPALAWLMIRYDMMLRENT